MHRHVVAHGDDLGVGVEDRAGIIAPLFYVGRERGAAQGGAHFFGDRVEDVLEDFQFDGIAPGGHGGSLAGARRSEATSLRGVSFL